MPALSGRIPFGVNIHDLAVFPDVAGSLALAGKQMCSLGGAAQGGIHTSKCGVFRKIYLSVHMH